MAKRFGRNQKRKLRAKVESANRALRSVRSTCHSLAQDNAKLQAKLRRSIEVNVEVLRDNSRAVYEARMECYRTGEEGLYLAQQIDARQIVMQRDRDEFIKFLALSMAKEMVQTIGHHW